MDGKQKGKLVTVKGGLGGIWENDEEEEEQPVTPADVAEAKDNLMEEIEKSITEVEKLNEKLKARLDRKKDKKPCMHNMETRTTSADKPGMFPYTIYPLVTGHATKIQTIWDRRHTGYRGQITTSGGGR